MLVYTSGPCEENSQAFFLEPGPRGLMMVKIRELGDDVQELDKNMAIDTSLESPYGKKRP